MFLFEFIGFARVSWMELDIIGDKESEQERAAVTNHFNLCQYSDKNTFSSSDTKRDWLDFLFRADNFQLFWRKQLCDGTRYE